MNSDADGPWKCQQPTWEVQLGHANLATTMIYLELVPDQQGFMERVT